METFLTSKNLLLVEDDINLANWSKDYLKQNGFNVKHLLRGEQVIPYLSKNNVDLILLDLMLPGISGLDVCKDVRRTFDTPVIIMTAKSEEFDEVLGLELGANDYIIKPAKPRALLARIKAQLRSSVPSSVRKMKSDTLTFGELTISFNARRVELGGEEIHLSNGLFSLLWLLATNAGKEVSREKVFQALLGREYDGFDRRFDVMISTLRKLLNDVSHNPTRIKTVWGKGYIFIPDTWEAPNKQKRN